MLNVKETSTGTVSEEFHESNEVKIHHFSGLVVVHHSHTVMFYFQSKANL
jgi:hypothetical protein